MEPFDRAEPVRYQAERSQAEIESIAARALKRMRTPATYRYLDWVTEGLIYFLVVFTPWAFGTTQSWSIWTMQVGCYLLGGILAGKWIIRWRTGYRPERFGARSATRIDVEEKSQRHGRFLTVTLAVLTGLVLSYCLISALNPRANFDSVQRRFEYFDYISWLPHTYYRDASWRSLLNYVALACFFWSVRDWLLARTSRERREIKEDEDRSSPGNANLPARLARLLWVLCVSGGLLALEGILQRLDGTGKLLWLVQPRLNSSADAQFGPYAYRSNAASYLNLLWPVCLGYWQVLRREAKRRHRTGPRVGGGSYVVLLPCAVLMAAAPIISTSRGGALVALASILASTAIIFFSSRKEGALIRAGMLSLFIVILTFAAYLGWKQLSDRLENLFVDRMSNREEIYENALPIAREFAVFGTGPGSFSAIYYLYREKGQSWAAYLHDDWLETRITHGGIGLGLILAALVIVLMRWWIRGGIEVPLDFMAFAWLAILGVLVHAKFDFPFQVQSIVLLFLLLCSMLSCFSRRSRPA